MLPKIDRQVVLQTMEEASGNASEAARRLGIHQNTARAIARKARRECVRCFMPVYPGRTMCQGCLDKDRERVKAIRAERRSAGVCLECGGPRVLGNRRFCEAHRRAAMERNMRYETKMKTLRGASQGGALNTTQKRRSLVSSHGPAAWDRWQQAGGACELCAAKYGDVAIHIHHIDEDPSNNVLENFICLCFDCHQTVHRLIESRNRKAVIDWFEKTYVIYPLR